MHSETYMHAKYNSTVEHLLGIKQLERCRNKLITKIRRGEFHAHVSELMKDKLELKVENLRFEIALPHEPDPSNKQARLDLYSKKREMLLKLAEKKEIDRRTNVKAVRDGHISSPYSFICWNITKSIYEEEIPDEIINSTRTALRAKHCGIPCVAPFYCLER